MPVSTGLGWPTALNFQVVGERVATTGDFALVASEVNPVLHELRAHGIEVTAIHSHMLAETPRLFFLHFWGLDCAGSSRRRPEGRARSRRRLDPGPLMSSSGARRATALAVALFVFGFGQELWFRYLPAYLRTLGGSAFGVGVFGTLKDLLDAAYAYPGGVVSDRLGTRRALLLFGALSTAGFAILSSGLRSPASSRACSSSWRGRRSACRRRSRSSARSSRATGASSDSPSRPS